MKWFSLCLTLVGFAVSIESNIAQDYVLHSFERQQLTDTYFSEGANFGDINRDGKLDAIPTSKAAPTATATAPPTRTMPAQR